MLKINKSPPPVVKMNFYVFFVVLSHHPRDSHLSDTFYALLVLSRNCEFLFNGAISLCASNSSSSSNPMPAGCQAGRSSGRPRHIQSCSISGRGAMYRPTLETIFEGQEILSFTPRENSLYKQADGPPPPPPPYTSNRLAFAPTAAQEAAPIDDSHHENLDDYEAEDPDLILEDYNDYNESEDEDYEDYEDRYHASHPANSNIISPAQAAAEPRTPPLSAVPAERLNSPSPLQFISNTSRNVESNSPQARSSQAGASGGSPRMARGGKAMPLSPRKRNEAAVRDRQGVLDGR